MSYGHDLFQYIIPAANGWTYWSDYDTARTNRYMAGPVLDVY